VDLIKTFCVRLNCPLRHSTASWSVVIVIFAPNHSRKRFYSRKLQHAVLASVFLQTCWGELRAVRYRVRLGVGTKSCRPSSPLGRPSSPSGLGCGTRTVAFCDFSQQGLVTSPSHLHQLSRPQRTGSCGATEICSACAVDWVASMLCLARTQGWDLPNSEAKNQIDATLSFLDDRRCCYSKASKLCSKISTILCTGKG
jgi:hypothetical protein